MWERCSGLILVLLASLPHAGEAVQEPIDLFGEAVLAISELVAEQTPYPLAFDPRVAQLASSNPAAIDWVATPDSSVRREEMIRRLGVRVWSFDSARACGGTLLVPLDSPDVGRHDWCHGTPGVAIFGPATDRNGGGVSFAFAVIYQDRLVEGQISLVPQKGQPPLRVWDYIKGFLRRPGSYRRRAPLGGRRPLRNSGR